MKKFSLMISLLLLMVISASCDLKEETHDPLGTFYEYMEAYREQNFERMYLFLDDASKETMTKEEYLKIYEMIYKGIPISEVTMEPRMDTIDMEQKIQGKDEVRIPTDFKLVKAGEEIKYSTDVLLRREVDEDENINYKVAFTKELVYSEYELSDIIETKEASPVRGEIFDRNHKPLAMNGEVLWIGMVSGKAKGQEPEAISALSQTFSITEEFILKKLNQSWVKDDMFVDMLKAPIERKEELDALIATYPGITYRVIIGRIYPYKDAAAHLTGYLGLVNEEEYEKLKPLGFPMDTMVGRSGLEQIYEEKLQGQMGTETFLMGKDGNLKEKLTTLQNNKGEDITLTIDIEEQVKLYDSMGGEPGTASIVDYKTGQIHALVSSPSYDPNEFVFGHTKQSYNALLEDEDNPLLNRFTKLYSPGSTIQPIVTAVALEGINFDENTGIDVKGKQWQKDSSWENYFVTRAIDPGVPVDLKQAFIYNDNIYFAQMALGLGGSKFMDGMKDFGVGEPLNLGFEFEQDKILSDGSLDNEILLADSGYGQGQVLFYSLTLPKALTAIGDEGNRKTLNLFKDSEEETVNILSKENADKVFNLMKEVVENPEGTGHRAYIEGRNLAGITGTAEENAGENRQQVDWFTVIEKSDEKPYITTMMLEKNEDMEESITAVERVKEYLLK